jgi:hypothetical protein
LICCGVVFDLVCCGGGLFEFVWGFGWSVLKKFRWVFARPLSSCGFIFVFLGVFWRVLLVFLCWLVIGMYCFGFWLFGVYIVIFKLVQLVFDNMYEVFSVDGVRGVVPTVKDDFYDGECCLFVCFDGRPVSVSYFLEEGVPSVVDFCLDDVGGVRDCVEDVCLSRVFEDVYVLGGCEGDCRFGHVHEGDCSDVRVLVGGVECCSGVLLDGGICDLFRCCEYSSFTCDYCGCSFGHSREFDMVDGFGHFDVSFCSGCYGRFSDVVDRILDGDELEGVLVSFEL